MRCPLVDVLTHRTLVGNRAERYPASGRTAGCEQQHICTRVDSGWCGLWRDWYVCIGFVCPPALVLTLAPFACTTVLLPAPRYPITELHSSKDIEITGSGVYDGRPPPAAVSKTWVRACGVACWLRTAHHRHDSMCMVRCCAVDPHLRGG